MKKIFFGLLVLASVSGCKKSSTGGDVEIAAFPQHHGAPIYGATVYVKFKAQDLPSDPTKNYDLKVVGEPDENHVHIKSLRYGKYFLYAVGYDSTIHQQVVGGIGIHIKWKDRKKELDINVPVSED